MAHNNDTWDDAEASRPSLQLRAYESAAQQSIGSFGYIGQGDARLDYREEGPRPPADGSAEEKPGTTTFEDQSDGDNKRIVSWEEGDPENPFNWSPTKAQGLSLTDDKLKTRKAVVFTVAMVLIVNSTVSSSLPSNAIPFIAKEYDVTSPQERVLPISIFMIGYVVGPIIWGPLSEHYGRRVIMLGTFVMFTIWTMACGLAPNYAALIVFRLFVGIFASSPNALVPGVLADLYGEPKTRGRAMAIFMATTVFGPLFAPVISGYCSTTIGWRWTFWVALIYAGVTLVPLLFIMPETYGPLLLAQRAQAFREADPEGNGDLAAPRDLEPPVDMHRLATVVIARPLRMITSELIVACVCAYLALCYAIFYMSFQAFPIIFQDLYGLSPGVTGLAFLPIGGGSLLSLPVFFAYDPLLRRARKHPRLAARARQEEYRRLPLACLGGPLFVVSLFWLGFSAREGVPVAVPMLAGVPFGAGFMLIFMALLNYLTDAYEIYAASANASSNMSRSFLAVVLPLATVPMFDRLGIAGACSVLGGLSAVMCVIPFLFIWKGETIRARSRWCIALREQKEAMARRVEEQRRRERAAMGAGEDEVGGEEEGEGRGARQQQSQQPAESKETV